VSAYPPLSPIRRKWKPPLGEPTLRAIPSVVLTRENKKLFSRVTEMTANGAACATWGQLLLSWLLKLLHTPPDLGRHDPGESTGRLREGR
jgi:hypothetical protein